MKTLIFNGSPRKNGDTVSLIRQLADSLEGECNIIDAYGCGISPCVDCRFCVEHDGCGIKDGMQEIYEEIRDCDNIVIASPIYFSELTGQLLAVLSRLQMFFCARFFRKEELIGLEKRGAVILVGGGNGGAQKAYGTAEELLKVMKVRGEIPLVLSHDTDHVPAVQDEAARAQIREAAGYLNRW